MLQFLFMDNRYIFAYASNFISIHSFNKVLTNFSNSRTFFTVPVTWNNLKTFVCQCTSTIVQSGYVHGWGGMVSDTQTDKGFSRPVERGFQRTRNSLHELNSCNINEKVGCAFCCLVAMSNIIVRRVIASSRLLNTVFLWISYWFVPVSWYLFTTPRNSIETWNKKRQIARPLEPRKLNLDPLFFCLISDKESF